jgi:hypothetical protein
MISAHLDYWGDPIARSILWSWFCTNEWFRSTQKLNVQRVGWKERTRHRKAFAMILWIVTITCLFLIPLLAVITNFRAWNSVSNAARKRIEAVEQFGSPAIAKASYKKQLMPALDTAVLFLSFKFVFVDQSGRSHTVMKDFSGTNGLFHDPARTIDVEKLARFIDRSPGSEAMVNIKYMPESPDLISVRGFSWHSGFWNEWDRLIDVFFIGSITFLGYVILAFVSIPWLHLLIGEDVFEASESQSR